MPKERWLPSTEMIESTVGGNRVLVSAVERYTAGGKPTGELRPSTQFRQPLKGAKSHGGHCCYCNIELDPQTEESFNGFCDECGKKHGDLP
jgi:hypothetical protein